MNAFVNDMEIFAGHCKIEHVWLGATLCSYTVPYGVNIYLGLQ